MGGIFSGMARQVINYSIKKKTIDARVTWDETIRAELTRTQYRLERVSPARPTMEYRGSGFRAHTERNFCKEISMQISDRGSNYPPYETEIFIRVTKLNRQPSTIHFFTGD